MKSRLGPLLAIVLTGVPAAFAHHGTAVNYDMDRTVTIEGVVTEYRWRNPHSALFLDVTDEEGKVTNFAIELPSPTLMSRGEMGWTRRTFNVGDHVVFPVHPSRSGAPIAVGGCERGCDGVLINGEPPEKEY